MAYRGRGRGRGRGYGGGGSFGYAKQEPFELFPDIDLPDIKKVNEEENLVRRIVKFENYWKVSPYYLEENTSKKTQSIGIERFSDKTKPKATITRDSLLQILELQKFPLELTSGSKGLQRQSIRKKVRWNPDIGLQNMFEKYERGEGAKKEGDNEEEEEEEEEEVEEEEEEEEDLSDDDYNQNVDFDDDEDDYNMDDDGDDEPTY
ncbi:uncharacterized protein LOC107421502 isoform X2 [Ziziphus jujuba]|uniref:DNA-directed RNA polymerase III subunit n=1 Tax=Ziziphus jujuba TaxID=326968 RepID=A0A6P3ZWR8_ZIZJJ|nr:uncharacterized protein LOC107421502 isoform X2 [Ziziphus jujuba]